MTFICLPKKNCYIQVIVVVHQLEQHLLEIDTYTRLSAQTLSSFSRPDSSPPSLSRLSPSPPLLLQNNTHRLTCHWVEWVDNMQGPTRHPRLTRKILEWQIQIWKPIVFIREPNWSRISHFYNPSVQVDSFPGANFLHIAMVLQKLSPNPNTQKMVLSLDINNKEQLFQQTSRKQLQELWRSAATAFPDAANYTPVINFSNLLPVTQQQNLRQIKNYITTYVRMVNVLMNSPIRFQVIPRDPVHWTKQTANDLFSHWLDQLNLETRWSVQRFNTPLQISLTCLKSLFFQMHRRWCWTRAWLSFHPPGGTALGSSRGMSMPSIDNSNL